MMTSVEKRASFILATIMSIRMVGLFMILPVFAVYAEQLEGHTPLLVGLALGAYGLSQAVLQIPFGVWSDRFGRKPVIVAGLLLFAVGSLVAALSDHIVGVIIGRLLQGAGAIAAAILALAADLTREEARTKIMALLGISIGMSFISAMALGPVVAGWIGVQGIFWLNVVTAFLAIFLLFRYVPTVAIPRSHSQPSLQRLREALCNPQLLRLNVSALFLHWLLTTLFVVIPHALVVHLPLSAHWQVYLPVMLVSVVAMLPLILLAEKYRLLKPVFIGVVLCLSMTQLALLYEHDSVFYIMLILMFFFTLFNVLEALLPSLVSRTAAPDGRGSAMGIHASAQFLGAFMGGVSGGWLYQHQGIEMVFAFCTVLTLLWLAIATTIQSPRYLSNHLLIIGQLDSAEASALTHQLAQVRGVAEAVVVREEGVAYLKVDHKILDWAALNRFAVDQAHC